MTRTFSTYPFSIASESIRRNSLYSHSDWNWVFAYISRRMLIVAGPDQEKRLRELWFGQQFFSDILQDIERTLHADFAGQNWIFILHTENSVIAYVHVGTHDVFPGARAVTIADGPESVRSGF